MVRSFASHLSPDYCIGTSVDTGSIPFTGTTSHGVYLSCSGLGVLRYELVFLLFLWV